MDDRTHLAWDGGLRPRAPAEGFATGVSVGLRSAGLGHAPPTPAPDAGGGPKLTLTRWARRTGPEAVRPSGRIRMNRR